MPHQCTACGRTFEDGSKEMLSGCPDCGGNKFQFKPAEATDGSAGDAGRSGASAATARKKRPENAGSPGRDASETGGDDRASAVDRAASTVRDWVSQRDDTAESGRDVPEAGEATPENDPEAAGGPSAPAGEDSAQASARTDVVSESELPEPQSPNDAPAESPGEAGTAGGSGDANADSDSNPGLKELREELNSQFESIRIVEPGQYELNLMELYEREEYIVSLQEDGKYVIEVPDAWDDGTR